MVLYILDFKWYDEEVKMYVNIEILKNIRTYKRVNKEHKLKYISYFDK